MKRSDYPAQEPLSAAGESYGDECWRCGEGIAFEEFTYGDDPYQRVALFASANPDGRVLIFWHGGGWTSGYKEWMGFMAPAFNAQGITFVSAGYRLAPQHLFPSGLDDCADTVKWVHEHIAQHGGDPRQIFVGGHSAGGHYAALLAVRDDWQRQRKLPPDVLRGCLPISGVFEFGEGSGLTARPRFLGSDATHDRDATPLSFVKPGLAPFLIAHGTRDFPHLMTQAERFTAALQQASAEATRIELQDRNHFGASFAGGEADGPWVPGALKFMARHAR